VEHHRAPSTPPSEISLDQFLLCIPLRVYIFDLYFFLVYKIVGLVGVSAVSLAEITPVA